MEAAIGAASGLIGTVLNKLSDELVEAYVASAELGLNAKKIKDDLLSTQVLLHEARRRGVSDNRSLNELVQQLSDKADVAEDTLDELHYFIIQDQLDGTKYAKPDRQSCHVQVDRRTDSSNDEPLDKLPFDRVAMSKKIKSVIEEIHFLCDRVSKSLKLTPDQNNTTHVDLNRALTGSISVENKLYGRSAIFEQTIKDITGGTYHGDTLSVLPIVGPGGIGKTTFAQHLYSDRRTQEHFTVRVWVCVSTDFDVLKLTQQIRNCIPETKEEKINIDNLDQVQKSIIHRLESKRFLIVLDDIWKCDSDVEWKTLLAPFTKGEAKGSMVLVTTRFPKIEERVRKGTSPINLQGLDHSEFFEFFQACAFGENKPSQQYSQLVDIGREIADKLKCSPLAAKTVARLLKKDLSWEHWRKVLENNEWKNQTNRDDIMPALKISYDYLPFHLKQCFSYFSLFPEDNRFNVLETESFWAALGIIDSTYRNNNYLEELVDNGFLIKEVDALGDPCYVMHDLLHELSRTVSAQECTNISCLSFSADEISQSIRHLAITIEDRYDDNFRQEMTKLKSRINIRDLRTLMIFREYKKSIVEILNDTFSEIEGIRVLFIAMDRPESLPKNFSKLLHLRYLKIRSPDDILSLPSTLPRFYHLILLDLQDWSGSSDLPKYFSRLVNLRHFIAYPELHSNVPEVGKIEHLEEVKEFHVKKESVGFELEELGKLKELGGELSIYNLEKVASKGEAGKANLALKKNLKKLVLVWDPQDSNLVTEPLASLGADVGDGLKPHDNLGELVIKNHGGAIGPSWLYSDIPIKHLESLTLKGVFWGTLPPFEQLPYLKRLKLKSIARVCLIGSDCGTGRNQSFMNLKEVVLVDMPLLERWIVEPNCHLFPVLESIDCRDCPNLVSLPFFQECSDSCTQQTHCPSLHTLYIAHCPKLSVSPIPPGPAATSIQIYDDTGRMVFLTEKKLVLVQYNGAALHNMDTSVISLELSVCESLPVDWFNPLIAAVNLKELVVFSQLDTVAVDLLSEVARRSKELPAGSFQLEKLCLDNISAVLVAPVCSHLSATLHTLTICRDERVESLTEEEEQALQLLTSLQSLGFSDCPGLQSLPQGLHSLSSLRVLKVWNCPEIRSLPMGMGGLPTSLQEIKVEDCSAELHEQVRKLKETNPELQINISPYRRRRVGAGTPAPRLAPNLRISRVPRFPVPHSMRGQRQATRASQEITRNKPRITGGCQSPNA